MPIRCEIVSQDRTVFEGTVDMVIAPGVEGDMGILPNHAPLLSALRIGFLKVRYEGVEEVFTIAGGVMEVQPEIVTILADAADRKLSRSWQMQQKMCVRSMSTGQKMPVNVHRKCSSRDRRRIQTLTWRSKRLSGDPTCAWKQRNASGAKIAFILARCQEIKNNLWRFSPGN